MRSDEEDEEDEEEELETEEENERIYERAKTQCGAVGKGCFLAPRMLCVVGAKRRQDDAK